MPFTLALTGLSGDLKTSVKKKATTKLVGSSSYAKVVALRSQQSDF